MQLAAIALGLVAFTALRASVLVANLTFAVLVVGGLGAMVALESVRPGGPPPEPDIGSSETEHARIR
jgi:hypothetical protein